MLEPHQLHLSTLPARTVVISRLPTPLTCTLPLARKTAPDAVGQSPPRAAQENESVRMMLITWRSSQSSLLMPASLKGSVNFLMCTLIAWWHHPIPLLETGRHP